MSTQIGRSGMSNRTIRRAVQASLQSDMPSEPTSILPHDKTFEIHAVRRLARTFLTWIAVSVHAISNAHGAQTATVQVSLELRLETSGKSKFDRRKFINVHSSVFEKRLEGTDSETEVPGQRPGRVLRTRQWGGFVGPVANAGRPEAAGVCRIQSVAEVLPKSAGAPFQSS